MKNIVLIIFTVTMFLRANSQQWITSNLGDSLHSTPGDVIIRDIRATSDDTLYITGAFIYSGTKTLNSIAVWRNNNWDKIDPNGLNFDWDDGDCVYKYNGILYAGGGMSSVNADGSIENFAMWDGQHWYGAGGGNPGGDVYDIIEYHDTIYLCGRFNAVSYTNPTLWTTTVASYYNDSLHNIDEGCYWAPGSHSSCFEIFNDELYIANNNYVWKYKGNQCWEMVPGSPYGWIDGLATDTFNTFLYAGGEFYVLGNENWKYLTMYDGYKWHKIGGNGTMCYSGFPHAYEVYRGDLYVGSGIYDSLIGWYSGYLSRWDGQNAYRVGNIGPNNYVAALEVYHDTLWVGGAFTYINDTMRAYGIAKWFMPDTGCGYLKPILYSLENNEPKDTFYLSGGQVPVQFYNNNPYVDSWDWDFGDGGTAGIKDPSHIYTDTGNYNVCVTVTHDSCVKSACKTITILNSSATLTFSLEPLNFNIYPNPTDGNFFVDIDLPKTKEQTEIRVFNPQGILKAQYPLQSGKNHVEIPSNSWEAGSYLVCLMVGNKLVKSKKLVLTK